MSTDQHNDWTDLVNGLTPAKDEIHCALDGTTIKVVPPLIVPQGILQPVEPAPVEVGLIPWDQGRDCWHTRVRIIDRVVVRVL